MRTTLDDLLAKLRVREVAQVTYQTRPLSPTVAKARMYEPGEPCPFCKAKGHISVAGEAELHPKRENVFRQKFIACSHSINVPAQLRRV